MTATILWILCACTVLFQNFYLVHLLKEAHKAHLKLYSTYLQTLELLEQSTTEQFKLRELVEHGQSHH